MVSLPRSGLASFVPSPNLAVSTRPTVVLSYASKRQSLSNPVPNHSVNHPLSLCVPPARSSPASQTIGALSASRPTDAHAQFNNYPFALRNAPRCLLTSNRRFPAARTRSGTDSWSLVLDSSSMRSLRFSKSIFATLVFIMADPSIVLVTFISPSLWNHTVQGASLGLVLASKTCL